MAVPEAVTPAVTRDDAELDPQEWLRLFVDRPWMGRARWLVVCRLAELAAEDVDIRPGVAATATYLGVAASTVQRIFGELVNEGLLVRARRGGAGGADRSTYRLVRPAGGR